MPVTSLDGLSKYTSNALTDEVRTKADSAATDTKFIGTSNLIQNTSNDVSDRITNLSLDEVANGDQNKFIINDQYDGHLSITETLTVSGNLDINGTTTTVDTAVYTTESLEVVSSSLDSNSPALKVTETGTANIIEVYNDSTNVITVDNSGDITTTGLINGASATEMGKLAGVSSGIQTQLNTLSAQTVSHDSNFANTSNWITNLNVGSGSGSGSGSYDATATGQILFTTYGTADVNMDSDIGLLNQTNVVSGLIYPNIYILGDNTVAFNKAYWDTKNSFLVANDTSSSDATFYYKTQSQLQLSSYFTNGNYYNLKFYNKNTVNSILQLEPEVVPQQSDPVVLSVGPYHSAVIFGDYVYTCGSSRTGRRGNNSTSTSIADYKIPSVVTIWDDTPLTGITSVVCGANFTMFLKGSNGSVFGCGENASGVLGRGNTTDQSVARPVQMDDTNNTNLTGVTKISCGGGKVEGETTVPGYAFAVFLMDDGKVMGTGYNGDGELTGGTTNATYSKFFLASSSDYLTNVKDIDCGSYHTIFLFNDNTVKCVGYNNKGQLGDDSETTRYYPVSISTTNITGKTGIDIVQVWCGRNETGIVYSDGDCYMWGYNSKGQLGVGSRSDKDRPTKVDTLSLNVARIAESKFQEYAMFDVITGWITKDGKAYVAGEMDERIVEGGTSGRGANYDTPTQIHSSHGSLPNTIKNMTIIREQDTTNLTFFIYNDTRGWVMGDDDLYQFFNTTSAAPTNSFTINYNVFNECITMFSNAYVLPISEGTIYGPDNNDYVGANDVNETFFQNKITEIHGTYANFLTEKAGKNYEVFTATVTKTTAGSTHAIILTDSIIYSWGTNQYGEGGSENTSSSIDGTIFYIVKNTTGTAALSNVIDVACGDHHSMFIMNDNTAMGCGLNTSGQLGVNDFANKSYPTPVVGIDGTGTLASISIIYAGKNTTMFITTSSVYSCGQNTNGKLGINSTVNANKPTLVSQLVASAIQDIKIGNNHTLALTTSGDVYGAGNNSSIQIGQLSSVTQSLIFVKMQVLEANGNFSRDLDAPVQKIYTNPLLDKSIIKIPEVKYGITNASNVIAKDVLIEGDIKVVSNVDGQSSVIKVDSNVMQFYNTGSSGIPFSINLIDSSFKINAGRGDVYIENNTYDNADGAGITIRASTNPVSGSIFSVRSSGDGNRLWVGQTITTTGSNDFGVGITGSSGTESNLSGYKFQVYAATGNVTTTGTINGASAAEISKLAGIGPTTIISQLNAKQGLLSSSTDVTVKDLTASGNITTTGTINGVSAAQFTEMASGGGTGIYWAADASSWNPTISNINTTGCIKFKNKTGAFFVRMTVMGMASGGGLSGHYKEIVHIYYNTSTEAITSAVTSEGYNMLFHSSYGTNISPGTSPFCSYTLTGTLTSFNMSVAPVHAYSSSSAMPISLYF